ncbi:MAG: YggT family protein [Xanthobacteraceae bacterium]|nr:YggT family protein [Xanthobacteraceae bacterium]QYK45367.1 MAG: YggT family protein [Xanthobacteraceae bacterium]
MDTPFLTYWYYSIPNFVLAAVMYTIIGRVLLSLFFDSDSKNYIMRFFVRLTDPFINFFGAVTPRATAPVVVWLFTFVWLFWIRIAMLYAFLLLGLLPVRSGG